MKPYFSQNHVKRKPAGIKLIFILLALVIHVSCNKKQEISILFTGDVILARGVDKNINVFGDSLIINSFKHFGKNDFTVINLETVLTDTGIKQKRKYNLKTSPEQALLLWKAGVTHASVANNHISDYGYQGFTSTIQALETNGIEPLGINKKPVILSKNGYHIAVISANLTSHKDFLPITSEEELLESVKRFRRFHPFIPLIVYLHWGFEYQPTPQPWQRELAHNLVKAGADAVLGAHPHVTQTIEFIDGKPVVYSLGNFIADSHIPQARTGYVVKFVAGDKLHDMSITPYRQKNFVADKLPLKSQIETLTQMLRFSDVGLFYNGSDWVVKPVNAINFSEPAKLWLIAQEGQYAIVNKANSDLFFVRLKTHEYETNTLRLPGKVSQILMADINNDGRKELLVLISKKVVFDKKYKKRIQIYTVKDNNIKPMWLGTKFINDVEKFDVISGGGKNYLLVTETAESKKIKRLYRWDNFGFTLVKTINTKK